MTKFVEKYNNIFSIKQTYYQIYSMLNLMKLILCCRYYYFFINLIKVKEFKLRKKLNDL